ncbi:MAG: PIN domain-containing protein [Elusimicrobia bacterium]|nr:PIN domain-containing protein [Elusimicrobiota bacterium]
MTALLDTNVLVYAACKTSPRYQEAARLVDFGLRHKGVFCVASQNLVEFLSVATRSRFLDPPLSAEDACRMIELMYRSRRLAKIYPKRGTVMRAVREGRHAAVTGARWFDLFLAATMRDAGVHVIITENARDFERIPGISVQSVADASAALDRRLF